MDADQLAIELHARMIRQSLYQLDFSAGPTPRRETRTMMEYQRKLKETKLKLVAADSLIRKIRTGEIDLKQLKKEVLANKERNRRNRREFIRKLEVLGTLTEIDHTENENTVPPEAFDATEDQKAILMLNNKKRVETLRKEARLLIEVVFGKQLSKEHNDLLQKEYHKNKVDSRYRL